MTPHRPLPRPRGFTLLELLIAMAIIGILIAIGMPQYTEYLNKGKLSEGQSMLSELQLRQEQYYQDNRIYLNGMTPRQTSTIFSTVSCVTANTNQTYTCTVTAPSLSVSYTVTESGAKTTTKPDGSTASCWLKSISGSC